MLVSRPGTVPYVRFTARAAVMPPAPSVEPLHYAELPHALRMFSFHVAKRFQDTSVKCPDSPAAGRAAPPPDFLHGIGPVPNMAHGWAEWRGADSNRYYPAYEAGVLPSDDRAVTPDGSDPSS